jgi:hypothetical protein
MRLKESTWGFDSDKMKFDSRWKKMWGVHKAKLRLKVLRSEKNDTWPWQTRWNLVIDVWTLATLWLIWWGNKLIRGKFFVCACGGYSRAAVKFRTGHNYMVKTCDAFVYIIVSCSCKGFFCGVPEVRNATCNIFFARKTWLFTREVWHATQNGQTMFIEFQRCGFWFF